MWIVRGMKFSIKKGLWYFSSCVKEIVLGNKKVRNVKIKIKDKGKEKLWELRL